MLIIIFTMLLPLQIDQVFKIVLNAAPNLCIGIKQNDQDNSLVLLQFKNLQSQLWRLLRTRDDTYRLQSVKHNLVMTFRQLISSEPVRADKSSGTTTNEEWMITKIDQLRWSIRIRHKNQADLSLNAQKGQLKEGTKIILYPFATASNDVWNIIEM